MVMKGALNQGFWSYRAVLPASHVVADPDFGVKSFRLHFLAVNVPLKQLAIRRAHGDTFTDGF